MGDSGHAALTDSCVVAHLTSGTLFVVGADLTSRQAANRAMQQLAHAKGRPIGAVLKCVALAHPSYYYFHYHRRYYVAYYGRAEA